MSVEKSPSPQNRESATNSLFLQEAFQRLQIETRVLFNFDKDYFDLIPTTELTQTNQDIFATLHNLDPHHYRRQPFLGTWSIRFHSTDFLNPDYHSTLIKFVEPFQPQNIPFSPNPEEDTKIYPPPSSSESKNF